MNGRILLIFSTLIPIVLFLLTPKWNEINNKKIIEYRIISESSIARVATKDAWQDLKYEYKGQAVEEGKIFSLQIHNAGTAVINREDFDSPLKIQIKDKGLILGARVVASEPEELGQEVNLSIDEGGVEIAPLLLNPNDSILIELLTSGETAISKISARISGLVGIKPKPDNDRMGTTIYIAKVDHDGPRGFRVNLLVRLNIVLLIGLCFLFSFIGTAIFKHSLQTKREFGEVVSGVVSGIFYLGATLASQSILRIFFEDKVAATFLIKYLASNLPVIICVVISLIVLKFYSIKILKN